MLDARIIPREEIGACQSPREKMLGIITPEAFQCHLRHVFKAAATIGLVIVSCVAISISLDIHAMRIAQADGLAKFQAGFFSRLDSTLWKIDTISTIESATNKTLAEGVREVRVQVKQSSIDTAANIKATSKATSAVVKETLDNQSQVLEKVAEAATGQPVVNVEVPKTPPPPVTVAVSPPAPTVKPQTVHTHTAATQEKRHPFHWLRKLWPFGGSHATHDFE